MNQQQVEQWIAQNGGSGAVQYSSERKRVPNPAYALTLPDGNPNPQYQPGQPATIDVNSETWVNSRTGARLSLSRRDDGDFDVIENQGADPNKPATSTGVTGSNPRVPPGSVPRIEGTPDGQGGYDNSQPIKAWHTPDGQVIYQPLDASERAVWERQKNGGLTDAERQAQSQKDDQTPVDVSYTGTGKNRVKVTTYKSGRKVNEAAPTNATPTGVTYETRNGKPAKVTKYDDGTETVEEQKPTAGQVIKGGGPNGEDVQAVTDPQTGQVSYQPISGSVPTRTGEPEGAPPSNVHYGQVTQSLITYRDWLNARVQDKTLTPEQADKLMQARLTQAQAAMAEQQGVVNTQTGIYGQQITEAQNERTDANNRRTQANSAYSTVMQSFVPLLKYMPEGGGQAFLDLLAHGMGAARQNAADWGGMKETPAPTLGPAAAAANAAPMPGTQGTFLAGAIPPNAIGAGSVGAVPAPGAPIGQVAAGVTATNAAAINPTGANVQAATDATMQGSNAAFGALGVPAQQAPPPAVNPAAGEPGHNPNAPVGMLPTGGSFLAPYQQQQQQPSALDQLLSDPSIPNHIVARAYEQVYGVPLSSYGMS